MDRAATRIGRLLVAVAATTVTAVSIIGGIGPADLDVNASIDVVTPRDSESPETPHPPASSSPPAGSRQPRGPASDAVRELASAKPSGDRPVPERASGRFDVARSTSDPTGAGPVLTYTVEVERGLPLRRRGVAQVVDSVLASPKGWAVTGAGSLQRVQAAPDIRVRLASPATTDLLCAPLDTGGRLSCRNGDLVVLNAWRWVNGADTYAGNLRAYRQYMINHEVGHALGNAHASCTEPGEPASVMVQQTKALDGCRPNPWPTIRR